MFEDVVLRLYNWLVQSSTMQDAYDAFCKTQYSAVKDVQDFYDALLDQAQNMAVFPDEFTLQECFLERIYSELLIAFI